MSKVENSVFSQLLESLIEEKRKSDAQNAVKAVGEALKDNNSDLSKLLNKKFVNLIEEKIKDGSIDRLMNTKSTTDDIHILITKATNAVTKSINDPNSIVSKALNKNLSASRRRE